MSNSFATPWTVACQIPLSMGLTRQEYWSGLSVLSPGALPDPGIELTSPALPSGFFTTEPPRKPSEGWFHNKFVHTGSHVSQYPLSVWFWAWVDQAHAASWVWGGRSEATALTVQRFSLVTDGKRQMQRPKVPMLSLFLTSCLALLSDNLTLWPTAH